MIPDVGLISIIASFPNEECRDGAYDEFDQKIAESFVEEQIKDWSVREHSEGWEKFSEEHKLKSSDIDEALED